MGEGPTFGPLLVGRPISAPYDEVVAWVGYLAVALGGILLGWLVAAVLIRRSERPRENSDAPETNPLASLVLANADAGYLVTDRDGNIQLANDRAKELQLVRAGMPDPRILTAIERTGISGEPTDVDLGQSETTKLADKVAADESETFFVRAVVEPLTDDLMLATAIDESAAHRVEAIRRDFVANVSHELKTPVGAIALLAEAVLDGSDDEESVRHFAKKMLVESTRLGTLVTELIALSRLQGGLRLQDLAVVEVDAVVSEAVARLGAVAETAGIEVVSDHPSGLLVRGDRTLLVTALANLIDNAVSYSAQGAPVSVTRALRDGQVEIAVTDRGIGIATEHQNRVFERFFRVDPARSRATGGTGLGLAIVKHVAANHAGQALLWSRPGTGSTFTLRLPQKEQATDQSATEVSRTAPDGAGGAAQQDPVQREAVQREGVT